MISHDPGLSSLYAFAIPIHTKIFTAQNSKSLLVSFLIKFFLLCAFLLNLR